MPHFEYLFVMKNLISIVACLLLATVLHGQPLTTAQIDQLADRALKTFDVPGMSIAIIKDGKVVHAKGYGLRSLKTKQPVNEHTLFGIASNSKAYTSAALAMLMEEGQLTWDDPVMNYVPEFRLYSPYVSDAFTIRDLLTHRSGLGLGAGDLMFWPDSNDFNIKDMIHNLRYLKQVGGFRAKYDYDNLLYAVAGEIISRVSGMSWEEFIERRIMQPLGMTESAAGYERLKDYSNTIDPHAPVNGKVQVISRSFSKIANAAGGIYSNVTDQSKWIILQLNGGRYGDDLSKRLFSDASQKEMWSSQTIRPMSNGPTDKIYHTHFSTYGLGWGLSDVAGYKQVSHSGGLGGNVTLTTLFPELKLGILVYTNQQSGAAMGAVTNQIKDGYLNIKGNDWIKTFREMEVNNQMAADKITSDVTKEIEAAKAAGPKDLSAFAGTYHDNWFGDVILNWTGGKLSFASKRSPRLSGEMFFYKGNTLIVRWKDRSFDADAFANFTTDNDGKPSGFKMKAISPLTDFSFDFHDLDLVRMK